MIIEILCEGYGDRAFWKGLLNSYGWSEDRDLKFGGKKITGGRYAYRREEHALIVTPCGGKTEMPNVFRNRLKRLNTDPLSHIVVNLDADTDAYDEAPTTQKVEGWVNKHAYPIETTQTGLSIEAAQGKTHITWIVWGSLEKHKRLPTLQTLEHMVCAAMLKAYPDRSIPVESFLAAEPMDEEPSAKNHAMSYMAKWAADRGSEDFFASIWEDQVLAAALKEIMQSTGAWQKIESLLT